MSSKFLHEFVPTFWLDPIAVDPLGPEESYSRKLYKPLLLSIDILGYLKISDPEVHLECHYERWAQKPYVV